MKILINGCFDCFHDGHKELFNYARKLLDVDSSESLELFVLVNSDESYFSLRGKQPKENQIRRRCNIKDYLKKLHISNSVYFFDTEEELKQLIHDFKPTFILKGSDYSDLTKVVGYPDWPILIKPRGKDKNGNDISSTKIKENDRNL